MRRSRDEDFEPPAGDFSFFKDMPDDLVVEFIISKDLNILQILNFCMALKTKGDDFCARKGIWDKLFIRRFGSDIFTNMKDKEHMSDPFLRVVTYSIWEKAEKGGYYRQTYFVKKGLDTTITIGTESGFSSTVGHGYFVIFQIVNNDNGAYSHPDLVVRDELMPKIAKHSKIKIPKRVHYPIDKYFFEWKKILSQDEIVRACIYVLLENGWKPVTFNKRPIWTKSCIGCNVTGEKVKYTCAGCQEVNYCGVECASKAWVVHKPICERISRRKARKILHDGHVNGYPLTEKQRRYFGYLSNQ